MSQWDAEQSCASQGGHLASYVSRQEQAEVEAFYFTAGFLLPGFHRMYWMGLDSSNISWPAFRWTDRSIAGPATGNSNASYSHWGKTDGVPEPNSRSNCTVADANSASMGAWGWNDVACGSRAIFMCRKLSAAGFYYNASNGHTYIFNASLASFDEAEATCRRAGAHLTSYGSYQEQAELEGWAVGSGFLLPDFHRFYWLGLNTSGSEAWPDFRWIDHSAGPGNSSYEHWGRYLPQQEPEPNFNIDAPPETCAGANYSQAYFNPAAWGWADQNCAARFPFMCKMLREWPGAHIGTLLPRAGVRLQA